MKTLQVHYLTNTDPTKFLFLLLGIALVIAILSIVGKFRGNTTTSKKRSSFFPADKKNPLVFGPSISLAINMALPARNYIFYPRHLPV